MYQAHTAVESIVRDPEQILPLLAEASGQSRWITLINPPALPNRQVLLQAGIEMHKIRIIHTQNRHQWLKTLSTCVCNGLNSLVVAWPEPSVSAATVKALADACRHGKSFCLLLGNRQVNLPMQQAIMAGPRQEEQLQLAL
ncbi:SulA-like leucine-rich domain-containing protein [Nitrincola iocasae]|uniref:Cell division inhibitor n=1 Tax=Nitrincola iocasae TaxID=2614693 RepID=A0A5J6LDQ7_9GAMM|nr:SulA-like leucine-rich domain-containing protein [Nitrincola iocasae]QEW06677.1 hypothetical protein F5I99_09275 [Nitrincola iocasae]